MGWCTLPEMCLLVVCIVQELDSGSRFHQIHVARNFLGSVVELEAGYGSACCRAEVDCTETPVVVAAIHHNSVGFPEIPESAGSVHQMAGSAVLVDHSDSVVAEGSAGTPSTADAVGPCIAEMDFLRHWNSCLWSTAF